MPLITKQMGDLGIYFPQKSFPPSKKKVIIKKKKKKKRKKNKKKKLREGKRREEKIPSHFSAMELGEGQERNKEPLKLLFEHSRKGLFQ